MANRYTVEWSQVSWGEFEVLADSEEEARQFAEEDIRDIDGVREKPDIMLIDLGPATE